MSEIERFMEFLSVRLESPSTNGWWYTTPADFSDKDVQMGIEQLRKAFERIRNQPPYKPFFRGV